MAFDNIIGTKSEDLDPLVGSISDDRIVIIADPVTGKLYRTTFAQVKADVILAFGGISYLDQIIEVPTVDDLPQPGAIKTIYVITTGPDANTQWRWGGSIYIEFPQGDGDVAAEAILRGNADDALQSNIDAEAAARTDADNALQTNITTEGTARTNADTLLTQKIASETNTRQANDNILLGLINTEGTTRQSADNDLSDRINNLEASEGIQSIVPGQNIAVDDSDPLNPIINAIPPGKSLLSGGAIWSGTDLTYDVSAINYFWNGIKTGNATQVTLDASDATNNRLDAIVISEDGTISVITGDASDSPITPAIPEDQLLIQYILVTAGSTEPVVVQENIYLDNAEWATANYTILGSQIGTTDFESTDSPKEGTKCIKNHLERKTGIRFDKGDTIDLSTYSKLSLWVRISVNPGTRMQLIIRFEDVTLTPTGNQLDLFNYGLRRDVLNEWQLCIVPVAAFAVTTVRAFTMIYGDGAHATQNDWDVDFITLTDGSSPVVQSPDINFYKDGTKIASQKGIDIEQGVGMTITATEDPVTGTVKYKFGATSTDGAVIDDTTQSLTKVYSSQKTEDLASTKADLVSGKVPSSQLPSYVDDVIEGTYVDNTTFQIDGVTITPETGKIYVDTTTDAQYRWSGSAFIELVASPGTTDNVPEGTTNKYFTTARAQAAINGTADRIFVTAGVIDIAATYVGQTSINTLGTITTGTWQATAIDATHGGTGQTGWAKGDLLYASGVNALARLAATTNGYVLTLASGVPTWAAASGGSSLPDMTGNAGKYLSTDGTVAQWGDPSGIFIARSGSTSLTGNWNAGSYSITIARTGDASRVSGDGIILQNIDTTTSNASSPSIQFLSYPQNDASHRVFKAKMYSTASSQFPTNSWGVYLDVYDINSNRYQFLFQDDGSATFPGAFKPGSINTGGNIQSGSFTSSAGFTSNMVYGTGLGGSASRNFLAWNGTVGGFSSASIVRVIYINPNITSLSNTDFRVWENTQGNVLFGTTAGSVSVGATTTIDASAILQVTSTTKGFLPPRQTTTNKTSIATPAEGLIVYDNVLHKLCIYNGSAWETITST